MQARSNHSVAAGLQRRTLLAAAGSLAGLVLGGCAATGMTPVPWQARLRGDTVALLGETHDNARLQQLRLDALRRALDQGWRPALVMEQFDIDRQDDIDRARRESPHDASHLIEQATAQPGGWNWDLYRPVVELALAHDLPLVAGNLPRATARRLVQGSYASVLGAASAHELGLDRALASALQGGQQRAVEAGHCGMLPARLLPGMARAQIARDAVMAERLRRHAGHGVVLLAGNGHVRRDLGVPRWLSDIAPDRVLVVGFLEEDDEPGRAPRRADRFDALVVAPRAPRDEDPCERLRKPPPRGAGESASGMRSRWSGQPTGPSGADHAPSTPG